MNQARLKPMKHKRVARSQPRACPMSSPSTNISWVPGLKRTQSKKRKLKTIMRPILYRKERANGSLEVAVIDTHSHSFPNNILAKSFLVETVLLHLGILDYSDGDMLCRERRFRKGNEVNALAKAILPPLKYV